MNAVRKRLIGANLHSLIELLAEGEYIDKAEKTKLLTYKKKRNDILHNLLSHISNPNFDKDLASAYEAGKEVLKNKKLKWIEELTDAREEKRIYTGEIIKESLSKFGIINKFTNQGYRTTKDENPKDRWHIYTVVGIEDWFPELQKCLKKGWYAHFWRKEKIKVVFSDKIFELDPVKKETWKSAIEYGVSQGIPREQLEFKTETEY